MSEAEPVNWEQAFNRSRLALRAYHQTAVGGAGLSVEYTSKAVRAFSEILTLHRRNGDNQDGMPPETCWECDDLWPCDTALLVMAFCGYKKSSD